LTPKQAKKLKDMAKKHSETESMVLRRILGGYLKYAEAKSLPYQLYKKISPIGMRVLFRTITIEQDRKLRELAERTGRKISELARETVSRF